MDESGQVFFCAILSLMWTTVSSSAHVPIWIGQCAKVPCRLDEFGHLQ